MSEGVEEEDVPVIYLACLYDLNGPREGSDEVFNFLYRHYEGTKNSNVFSFSNAVQSPL